MTAPTPLDRLLAEAIPTRPPNTPTPGPRPEPRPWTPAEQDAHWQALCEAVGTPGAPRPRLRLVPADDDTERAAS